MLTLINDPDLGPLAKEELAPKQEELSRLEAEIDNILKPPVSQANAIIEIQAGVGGDESSLFVELLFGMYTRYAKKRGWEVEITDVSHGNQGGFKNISLMIEGSGAYNSFKHESGTHKIQRVSPTDSAKRMHTSAATVVVFPEIADVDYSINKSDVKVEKTHSSGPGGQNVNKVETAIRLTHLPTNINVRCEGRSQHANLERAWKIITSRVSEYYRILEEEKQAKQRAELRGTGSRSGCIRTYNFPQDRFTDHRLNQSWFGLDKLMQGSIETVLEDCQKLVS